MSDLIRRDEVLETYADIYFDLEQFLPNFKKELDKIYDALQAIPTEEPLVTVKAKQNEGLYLDTDEETLLETEYIVVATDGMYKEYIHETDGKPRRGKWIDHPTVENIGLVDLQGNEMEIVIKMCSECGYEGWETNYCPNCGAKMERSE